MRPESETESARRPGPRGRRLERLAQGIRVVAVGLLAAIATAPAAGAAATLVANNVDSAGVGFNDPTPASAVGGNAGATLGQQRLNALSYALNIWGAQLTSAVTIVVQVGFSALSCSTYASGAPVFIHRNFTGAPIADTWYPAALADALSGVDQSVGVADINVLFNSTLDSGACGPNGWWYGYSEPPAGDGRRDFVATALHEIAHGLGFKTFVNSAGEFYMGSPDVFSRFLYDETAAKAWTAMSNAERATSLTNANHVVWTGAATSAVTTTFPGGVDAFGRPRLHTPASYSSALSAVHWAPALSPDELLSLPSAPSSRCSRLAVTALQDLGWTAGQAYTICTGRLFSDGFDANGYAVWSNHAP